MTSLWGMTPRQSIEAECARRGRAEVVGGCVELLRGRQSDEQLLLALGGPPARHYLTGATPPDYWLRVWATRGLLWAWSDEASPALRTALADEHWRVREMALKVVARHLVGDVLPAVQELRSDPGKRVRAAAERAVVRMIASRA